MARKQTLELAGDATAERIVVAAVSRVGVLVPPWVVLVLLFVVAAISHARWGSPPAVTWATMFGSLAAVALAALTWLVSHTRGLIGRAHSTLTTGGAGLWFTVATITGPTQGFTLGAWFFAGGALAVAWNIRAIVRRGNLDDDRHPDPLGRTFDQAKEAFGLKGASVRTTEVSEHAIKGRLQLPPGEKTPADVLKKVDAIEGGLRFPPGSVVLAGDEDDHSRMHVTVTDPRVMKRPIPWAGPYRPGGSIADALRIGVYQDMTEVLTVLVDGHLQIMGQSGAGKSIGGCWNFCAEIMTRQDAAIFAVDLAKDAQTFGPMRGGLHRFITSKSELVEFIRALHKKVPERTKWLAEHGYQKWQKGCGLTFWVIWIEEAAKVFDELGSKDEEKLLQIVKELRSAGGRIVMSLQRSDYSQMPTIARGQLGKMCFGVADSDDASFGLSERQKEAGASPELWGEHQPGMAYLDVPGVPETHYAVPLRTYAWGDTDRAANAAMRAHVAQWPAAGKTVDEFTASLSSTLVHPPIPLPSVPDEPPAGEVDDQDDDAGDAVSEYQTEPDPDPSIVAGPDDEVTEPTSEEAARFVIPEPTGTKMSPPAARGLVHDWLRHRAEIGRPTFTATDPELMRVRDATGNTSRGWSYKVIAELVERGVLDEDDSESTTRYTIADLAPLDGREPVTV
ncbi:MAG TPA: hypothetical protein VFV01_06905 [Spirillospora sp.]|nr:hypothetical protein [Spirillospora sp.]